MLAGELALRPGSRRVHILSRFPVKVTTVTDAPTVTGSRVYILRQTAQAIARSTRV